MSTTTADLKAINSARFINPLRAAGMTEPVPVDVQWNEQSRTYVFETHVATCLVRVRRFNDGRSVVSLEAVKVPRPTRGFKLFVSGLSHWKKWGRISKGIGYCWTGRKSDNGRECEAQLVAAAVLGGPVTWDSSQADKEIVKYDYRG